MRKLLTVIGVLAVLGIASFAAAAAKKVNLEEQQLYQMYFSFCNAWNHQNAAQLAEFYSEDADHFSADGQVATGREEIQNLFTKQLGGVYAGTNLKLTLDSLRFLSPEIALANGSFELTGFTGPGGKTLPPRKGLHTDIWAVRDGQWKVTASRTSLPARIGPPATAAPTSDEGAATP